MSHHELKILLTHGPPAIVFDARGSTAAGSDRRDPFFTLQSLRNAIVLKTGEGQRGLKTRIYLPFDSTRAARGGVSMECAPAMSLSMLEDFLGMKLDKERAGADLRKLEILASTPSFAPFLLRDAFERGQVDVDPRHFQVSDAEVLDLKDSLKAKLKPLAAMALPSGDGISQERLDALVNKLWDLDDHAFLEPFGRSLRIPPGETVATLYAWLGVSCFNREFTRRQPALRKLADWLVAKPPFPPGTREDIIAEYEADRRPIRDGLRASWAAAGAMFDRFNASYDHLIHRGEAGMFISCLERIRDDFADLGMHLALLEQTLCIVNAIWREPKGSTLATVLLRNLSASMQGNGPSLVAA